MASTSSNPFFDNTGGGDVDAALISSGPQRTRDSVRKIPPALEDEDCKAKIKRLEDKNKLLEDKNKQLEDKNKQLEEEKKHLEEENKGLNQQVEIQAECITGMKKPKSNN